MAPDEVSIEVVYAAGPGSLDIVPLKLRAGATLAEAVDASGLMTRHALTAEAVRLGIWGKVREPGTALRERDRVEIYRGLKVDPKEARRQRYQRHREKAVKR